MASKTKTSIYKPVHEFPYLERYKTIFSISDDVAFPYNGFIYSNKELEPILEEHERVHFKQQEEIGADEWEEKYLTNPQFRIKMEVEAYNHQLTLCPKEYREGMRTNIAKVLSSPIYGNVVTYREVLGMLK